MPTFYYQTEQRELGTVDAQSPNEALRALQAQGHAVRAISTKPITIRPATPVAPPPQLQSAKPSAPDAAQTPLADRGPSNSLSEQFFLVTQLGQLYKAGFGAGECWRRATLNERDPKKAEIYAEIARQADLGTAPSELMAQRPNMFHESAGWMQVGELTGSVPETLARLADILNGAIAHQRSFWWVIRVLMVVAVIAPIVIALRFSLLSSLDNGAAASTQGMIGLYGRVFLYATLPALIVTTLAAHFGLKAYWSAKNRTRRDSLALRTRSSRDRIRSIEFSNFTFALSQLAKAGFSPYRAWMYAAGVINNSVLREEISQAAVRNGEGSRLSDALASLTFSPPAFLNLVRVGEQTGSVPDALIQVHMAALSDAQMRNEQARIQAGATRRALMLAISGIVILVIIYLWMSELPAKVLQDV